MRQWHKNNPGYASSQSSKRRLLIEQSVEHYAPKDIKRQLKTQNHKCWWCLKTFDDIYHIDHRIPLSRGGSNGAGNIVIACPSCNLSKSNKLPSEWIGRLL